MKRLIKFLLGLGVGAGVAMLLAPKSGRELRKQLMDGASGRMLPSAAEAPVQTQTDTWEPETYAAPVDAPGPWAAVVVDEATVVEEPPVFAAEPEIEPEPVATPEPAFVEPEPAAVEPEPGRWSRAAVEEPETGDGGAGGGAGGA